MEEEEEEEKEEEEKQSEKRRGKKREEKWDSRSPKFKMYPPDLFLAACGFLPPAWPPTRMARPGDS